MVSICELPPHTAAVQCCRKRGGPARPPAQRLSAPSARRHGLASLRRRGGGAHHPDLPMSLALETAIPAPHASTRHWSTSAVDPQHALAFWVDTICRSFMEIDIDTPERDRFRAQLDQMDFGPGTLYLVEAGEQIVRRTPARIAGSHEAFYFLMQLRQGQARFQQAGRECFIGPGDCVLVDCKQPYTLDCLPTTRTVALRFRQDWLANWLPSPERFAARPFRPDAGWSAALSVALANLETAPNQELALPAGVVAEQIAALFALAAGPDAQVSSSSEKLLRRLKQTIRDRCQEPDLSPGAVADLH